MSPTASHSSRLSVQGGSREGAVGDAPGSMNCARSHAQAFRETATVLGIRHAFTGSSRLQTNGKVERFSGLHGEDHGSRSTWFALTRSGSAATRATLRADAKGATPALQRPLRMLVNLVAASDATDEPR